MSRTTRLLELLEQVEDALPASAKAQLKAEIIVLTHDEPLHEVNVAWRPKAEELLRRPDLQEVKRSEGEMRNLRYKAARKTRWLARLQDVLGQKLPYFGMRYAF